MESCFLFRYISLLSFVVFFFLFLVFLFDFFLFENHSSDSNKLGSLLMVETSCLVNGLK